jgi:hypothetical protein
MVRRNTLHGVDKGDKISRSSKITGIGPVYGAATAGTEEGSLSSSSELNTSISKKLKISKIKLDQDFFLNKLRRNPLTGLIDTNIEKASRDFFLVDLQSGRKKVSKSVQKWAVDKFLFRSILA